MMTHQKIKGLILTLIVVILVLSNLINYFYCYKTVNDIELQWSVAIYSIAIELFLFSLYIWLTEIKRHKNKLKIVVSGWMTIYLLINLIGVVMGYNLHTKGFMTILFTVTFFGVAHFTTKLWQKFF